MPRRAAWFGLIVLALAAAPASACDTPVFRVAMFDPRWAPHRYEFCLFQDGKLAQQDQKRLDDLNALLDKHDKHVNCELEVLHRDKHTVADWRESLQARRTPVLPWMVVRHPLQNRIAAEVWAGPWQGAPLEQLLQSPGRQHIGKRLLAGETSVWALIESGNQAKDDAAVGLLTKELKELQGALKLPEAGPGGKKIAIPEWAPPAGIAFSVLRLSRTDAAEKWFVAMLLGLEDDLDRYASEPIVFPVFGRGAALEPLIGKGITAANIGKVVRYLIGPCVCEEKELNPVKDLLMVADWEAGRDLPKLAGLFQPVPVVPPRAKEETQSPQPESSPTQLPPRQALVDSPATTAPSSDGRDGWLVPGTLLGLGVGLAVVIGAGLVMILRKRRI